jgi:hypothetical protein
MKADGGRRDLTGASNYVLWMTSQRDGRDHAVEKAEFEIGSARGWYRAICSAEIIPSRVQNPVDGPSCAWCTLARIGLPLQAGQLTE